MPGSIRSTGSDPVVSGAHTAVPDRRGYKRRRIARSTQIINEQLPQLGSSSTIKIRGVFSSIGNSVIFSL